MIQHTQKKPKKQWGFGGHGGGWVCIETAAANIMLRDSVYLTEWNVCAASEVQREG